MFAQMMKFFLISFCANMAGALILLWACSCARHVWISMLAYLAGIVLLSCSVAFMFPLLLSNGSLAILDPLARIRPWLCLLAIGGAVVWCRQFIRSHDVKRAGSRPAIGMKHHLLLLIPTMLAVMSMIDPLVS